VDSSGSGAGGDGYGADQGFPADLIDTTVQHSARMYDYLLGGWDNYAVDREAAQRLVRLAPEARPSVRANRAFLQRAVRYAAQQGVAQFLDIGTGLPTSPSVHEVAKGVVPGARTAYVDNDPIVHVHAQALLREAGAADIALGDVREPEAILAHPVVRELIDFDRPVCLLLLCVLHFVADEDDPAGIVRRLCAALPEGSYLVLSHTANDVFEDRTAATQVYQSSTAPLYSRNSQEIAALFPTAEDGFVLLDPGVVQVSYWRPDGDPGDDAPIVGFRGGVARKHSGRRSAGRGL
jgi:S-adenosyl methyltransferase